MKTPSPEGPGNGYEPPQVQLLGTLPQLTQGAFPTTNGDYILGTLEPIGNHTS